MMCILFENSWACARRAWAASRAPSRSCKSWWSSVRSRRISTLPTRRPSTVAAVARTSSMRSPTSTVSSCSADVVAMATRAGSRTSAAARPARAPSGASSRVASSLTSATRPRSSTATTPSPMPWIMASRVSSRAAISSGSSW